MNLITIIKSVLSSFIGIQKQNRLDEDNDIIEKTGILPFFITAVVLASLLIILLSFVVSIILE
ncbi:DUF2970 domain-containing protein [Methylophilaceae bacterium]|jgi:hypothetical protein|nr:DUF2970 domain-containing protein [Methylophilaceae bacterium]